MPRWRAAAARAAVLTPSRAAATSRAIGSRASRSGAGRSARISVTTYMASVSRSRGTAEEAGSSWGHSMITS